MSKEELKTILRDIMEKNGGDISMAKYQAIANKNNLPHFNTIVRNLGGSWEAAKEIASGRKNLSIKEQIINDKEDFMHSIVQNTTKKKYKKLLKEKVFQDELINLFKSEIKALPTVKIPNKTRSSKSITEEEAILLIGDTHIGEVVSKEETGGFGNYNFNVFNMRMGLLFEKVIDLTMNKMQGYSIPKLNVVCLGDMISGIIHDELVESADDTVIEWVLSGAIILSQLLIDLAQYFLSIEVTGVVGNHGRLSQKVRYKKRYVNWDYLMYQIMSIMCINQKNIIFDIPKAFFIVKKIAGQEYLILHGDNIQMYKSIPWYGIERMITSFSQLLASQKKIFQHVLIAHFHNQGVLDKVTGEIILNGSVIGGNEYSLGKLFRSSDPKQMLMGTNPIYGPTWRFPINLLNADESNLRYTYTTESIDKQVKNLL